MSCQRNLFQMNEQDKTLEKQLTEGQMGSLPDREFKVMIIKMIKELGKRADEKSEKLAV